MKNGCISKNGSTQEQSEAVSYTHLDVYKRQPYTFAAHHIKWVDSRAVRGGRL